MKADHQRKGIGKALFEAMRKDRITRQARNVNVWRRRMDRVFLRKLEDSDISIFKKWLYCEHVAKWYTEPMDWLDEILNRNTKYQWIKHFIVETEGLPIGFCQYYDYALSEETWHGNMDVKDTYSIDYLIGETNYLGRGLGKSIVSNLINKIQNETAAKKIIVQPEVENKASRNTLLSAGFLYDVENDVYYKKIDLK